MQANQSRQFDATVGDATKSAVIWMVDGVIGGAPEIGTITEQGLYTAPANMEKAVNATVTAVSAEDQTEVANVRVCNEPYSRPGNTYYVDTTGSNTNPGTVGAPWRNIQYAVDHVQAGDTILVRGGVYNETVTVTKSGSADGGFITLMEYPGENAVIDGTGLVREPTGMRGLITLHHVSYFRVKDFEIRNYKSDSEFIVIGLLVHGSGERIEIRNNDIHAIEANNLPSNGNANGLGIAVYGTEATPIRNVIIDGNELHALKTGRGESLTVGGNVEGWQITRNSVHDNNFIGIDAIGYYVNGAEYDRARNGWIASNAVFNLSSAGNQALTIVAAAVGIYVDGGRNITIERNHVDAAEGGIWLLSEHPGKNTSNVTVRNNLVRFNQNAGILVGGYTAAESGGAENITVVNNTLFQNNTRNVKGINAGELQILFNATDVVFENNILYAGEKGYAIVKFSPADPGSVTLGNNIYYTTSGGTRVRWFWIDTNYYNDGGPSDDFNAFRAASGDSSTSIVADPDFVNVDELDLRLAAGSPGVDSGRFVSAAGIADYAGNPRVQDAKIDRGAYEHVR
ncbi:right-handed parallel beta-helix repeat-containing protein [Paramesorhizobium deserti]|nr:right-handed parallel beta-helix repeat-containing protein [Paramesorhizobium deserti]